MSQGITFDTASGIDLTGWWSNPRTGESYRVVDQFFQDNVLYVKTDKGQLLNYNVIQNMVKSDGPLNGPVQQSQPATLDSNILLQGLEEEEVDLLTRPIKSQQPAAKNEDPKVTKMSVNKVIIEKAFSKAPEGPAITLGIDWDWNQLSSTVDMLKNTMDIPMEEISEYVYTKYAEKMVSDIKGTLSEFLERGGLVRC